MHLKNFSLIETYEGSGEYILSPAYDLLPVNLLLPEDNEEFALPMNSKRTNLHKKDFLEFAMAAHIPPETADRMIRFLLDKKEAFLQLNQESLLPPDMKARFAALMDQRFNLLS